MDFEPLDAELEDALRPIVEEAYETGWASVGSRTPEYRALKAAGMFARSREYYDGEARVEPSYAAMKYFERKAAWLADGRKQAVASVAGSFIGGAAGALADAAARKVGL